VDSFKANIINQMVNEGIIKSSFIDQNAESITLGELFARIEISSMIKTGE
jgi:hypothetical protein